MNLNWKQITVALVLGLILGGAVGRWSVYQMHYKFKSPEKRFERKFNYFSRTLNLDDDQKAVVRRIFEEKRSKIKTIRNSTRQEIRTILRDDQIPEFEKMEERWKKRHARKNR